MHTAKIVDLRFGAAMPPIPIDLLYKLLGTALKSICSLLWADPICSMVVGWNISSPLRPKLAVCVSFGTCCWGRYHKDNDN